MPPSSRSLVARVGCANADWKSRPRWLHRDKLWPAGGPCSASSHLVTENSLNWMELRLRGVHQLSFERGPPAWLQSAGSQAGGKGQRESKPVALCSGLAERCVSLPNLANSLAFFFLYPGLSYAWVPWQHSDCHLLRCVRQCILPTYRSRWPERHSTATFCILEKWLFLGDHAFNLSRLCCCRSRQRALAGLPVAVSG